MNKLKSILCLILILGISYTLEAQTQEIPSDQDIKVKVKQPRPGHYKLPRVVYRQLGFGKKSCHYGDRGRKSEFASP